MRQDIKHKIVEHGKSNGRRYYKRQNAVDVLSAPSRESMSPNRNKWERWNTINYDFINRLIKGHVGKNYDEFYSELKAMCRKNRWHDEYLFKWVKQQLNVNETFIKTEDGNMYFERCRWGGKVLELHDGELYVDENRIIQRFVAPNHLTKKERIARDLSEAKKSEFIQDGFWFKKINGVWFVADVVRQSIKYQYEVVVCDWKWDGEKMAACNHRPKRNVIYTVPYHAYFNNHVSWLSTFHGVRNDRVFGSVFDVNAGKSMSYHFTTKDSVIAINKRSCPGWMIRIYCGDQAND